MKTRILSFNCKYDYTGSKGKATNTDSTLAVPGQYSGSTRAVMCLYRIKYDRIKCDRIKYAFTGSYVFLQDHMCMLPDQV